MWRLNFHLRSKPSHLPEACCHGNGGVQPLEEREDRVTLHFSRCSVKWESARDRQWANWKHDCRVEKKSIAISAAADFICWHLKMINVFLCATSHCSYFIRPPAGRGGSILRRDDGYLQIQCDGIASCQMKRFGFGPCRRLNRIVVGISPGEQHGPSDSHRPTASLCSGKSVC